MSIIAVFGGFYSGGEEIAREVANRLNYTFVSDNLLNETAKTYETSVDKLERAMTGELALFNSVTHEWEKSIMYIKAVLAEYLLSVDIVYYGSALHFIPTEISHVLKVAIVADQKFMKKEAVKKYRISKKEATSLIKKSEDEISFWTERLLFKGPWDASIYDVKISVPSATFDKAVNLICENVAKTPIMPTDRSIQATVDFHLATKVNLVLLEHGYYYCDVTVNNKNIDVVINKNLTSSGTFVQTILSMRYKKAAEEIKDICLAIDGIEQVETRPGVGYRRSGRVLLVDDEVDYATVLSERLQMRDIEADVVHSGDQALSTVLDDEPDVMVLDLRMPGIDGMEVLRRMKKNHPRVEVIIVTGHGDEKDKLQAMELGAFAFLTKPVDINVLTKTMKAASLKAHSSESMEEN